MLYLDGSPTYETVSADLRELAARAAPGAVAVVAGASAGSPARAAWADAEVAGLITWEGTSLESPGDPASDALLWGRVKG